VKQSFQKKAFNQHNLRP